MWGGVVSEPVEQVKEQPSGGEVGGGVEVNTPDAGAPGESDPEEDVPSDIVVFESDATEENAEDVETVPDEDETVPGDEETVPGEEEKPGETETVPGANEQPEGDPDANLEADPDTETDPGLETGDEAVTPDADDDIMLMAIPEPESCKNGKHGELEHHKEEYPVSFSSVGPKGHKCRYDIYEWDVCTVCGLILPETYKKTGGAEDLEIVPHTEFYDQDGVCTVCGYTCPHPALDSVEWKTEYVGGEYIDEDTCRKYESQKKILPECPDCGAKYIMKQRAVDADVSKHIDEDNDSCCDACDAYIGHTHKWVFYSSHYEYAGFANLDGKCVASQRTRIDVYSCEADDGNDCYAMNKVVHPTESGQFTMPHAFEEGVCLNCGYRLEECAHKNARLLYSKTDDRFVGEIRSNGNGTHTGTILVENKYYCPDCGVDWNVPEKKEVTKRCDISELYGIGRCYTCGYEEELPVRPDDSLAGNCKTHTQPGFDGWIICDYYTEGYGVATDDQNGWTHTYSQTLAHIDQVCPTCEAEGPERAILDEEYCESHSFSLDGKCAICGADRPEEQKNCKHQGDSYTEILVGERRDSRFEGFHRDYYTVVNETQHVHSYIAVVRKYCSDCDALIDETFETRSDTEPHEFDIYGICEGCDYVKPQTCAHDGDTIQERIYTDAYGLPYPYYEIIDGNASEHYVQGIYTEYTICAKCGVRVPNAEVKFGYATKSNPAKEPHRWSKEEKVYEDADGSILEKYCLDCGYVVTREVSGDCDHQNLKAGTRLKDKVSYEEIPGNDREHMKSTSKGWKCPDCKQEIYSADEVTEEQPHSFKDGKCTLCGYVKPAPANDGEQEEASDEPVFESVAPGTPVHGMNVGDGSRMATALCKVVAGIQEEYGPDVGIFVHNADKIFTPEEYKSLNAMPVHEQILVVLSALGYGDEVQNGLGELGIELSSEAQALIGQINLRIAEMSDAEAAEYQAQIARHFPMTVDADAQHTEIVLEIRVKLDSGYRMERYGFDLRNGAWFYSTLDVAGADD